MVLLCIERGQGHARYPGATEEDGMPIVLVAIEPRSYAQAIGQTLAALRPSLGVRALEPEDVADEAGRLSPALVLCSAPCPSGATRLPGTRWVEFRPYDEPETLRVDGRDVPPKTDGGTTDLADLLRIVDQAVFAGKDARHGAS